MRQVKEPTYRDVLTFIETNGVRDAGGGYTVREDKTLSGMMGVLCPLRESPGVCFPRQTVNVFYEPKNGTPEHHAATCLRLSRLQDGKRYFPAEAMRHLRMAAGGCEYVVDEKQQSVRCGNRGGVWGGSTTFKLFCKLWNNRPSPVDLSESTASNPANVVKDMRDWLKINSLPELASALKSSKLCGHYIDLPRSNFPE